MNSPKKSLLVRDVLNLTPKYSGEPQKGINRATRSLSAKSLFLPKKRVLVSPFKKNARKEAFTGALLYKRALSALGQTAKC